LTPKTAAVEKFKGDQAGGRRSTSPKIRSEGALIGTWKLLYNFPFQYPKLFSQFSVKLTTAALMSFSGLPPLHCKKRLTIFPSPAGMSQTKPSLAGNNYIVAPSKDIWMKNPGSIPPFSSNTSSLNIILDEF
jgi:hypothetical protein